MVRCNSLQKRILLVMVTSELLLATALASITIFYTRHRLLSGFDSALSGRAMSVAALVHHADETASGVSFDQQLAPPTLDSSTPDLYEVVVLPAGVIAHSPEWPADFKPPEDAGPVVFESQGVKFRGIWLRDVPMLDDDPALPPVSVFYAASTSGLQAEFLGATAFITGCSLVLLIVTMLVGIWGIRRGLLPLGVLAEQAVRVSSTNWDVDVNLDQQPEELRPLSQALLDMLARLRQSFVQQREFVGNAAHELKTPVAILKSTLQAIQLKQRTGEEYRAGLEQALADLDRLEKLLTWMLRLARAERWASGSARTDIAIIEVNDTCEEALARVSGLARSCEVFVQLFKNGRLPLRADPDDLQIIWVNLLENAIRFSPQHGTVEMHVTRVNDRGRVRVVDYGCGIPEQEITHVFERFHRGDLSRTRETGGFGLGLALAKAFTEAYGGSIQLSSTPQSGTTVVVELPLLPEASNAASFSFG